MIIATHRYYIVSVSWTLAEIEIDDQMSDETLQYYGVI